MQETPVWFLGQESPRRRDRLPTPVFLSFLCGSAGKESACNMGDRGLIPGLVRSPGEGNGNTLQHSCPGLLLLNLHSHGCGWINLGKWPWILVLNRSFHLSLHQEMPLLYTQLPKSAREEQKPPRKQSESGLPWRPSCSDSTLNNARCAGSIPSRGIKILGWGKKKYKEEILWLFE